jgi:hypothetical protein
LIDFVTIAVRTAYSQTNLARLISQREDESSGVKRALEMFHKPDALDLVCTWRSCYFVL